LKKIQTAHIILVFILVLQNLLSFGIEITGIKLSMSLALLISQLTILLPFIIYCIFKRQNPFKVIRFKKISVKSAILCAVIALCSYPVVICLNMLSMLFVENAMQNIMTEVVSNGILFSLLFMAVMPAIVEETIFRGVVYNAYSKRKPLLGVFLSAFLFGAMHMNFNQMPYAFFLGIIMALVMEACDSVIAPMIVHFTLNGSSTLLSCLSMAMMSSEEINQMSQADDFKTMLMESYRVAIAESGMELTEKIIPMLMTFTIVLYVIIGIGALAIVLALVYGVFRMNGRKPFKVFKADHSDTEYIENKKGKYKKNRMIDLPALLFTGYCIVMCVLSAVG